MARILNVISHSEAETLQLARKVGQFFKPGDVVVLTGELGSGKTVFVRGLVSMLGMDENIVSSPSYTLVNEYISKDKQLYHFDLYRMHDLSELQEVGWDDYLQRQGLIVVEWGEKANGYLPKLYYSIEFTMLDEQQREINIGLVES